MRGRRSASRPRKGYTQHCTYFHATFFFVFPTLAFIYIPPDFQARFGQLGFWLKPRSGRTCAQVSVATKEKLQGRMSFCACVSAPSSSAAFGSAFSFLERILAGESMQLPRATVSDLPKGQKKKKKESGKMRQIQHSAVYNLTLLFCCKQAAMISLPSGSN